MDNEVQIFKALSEKIRLRVMLLLLSGELCVCDLEQILGQTQSKISRHLTYLKNSGLVTSRREGTWMHYSIIKGDSAFITALTTFLESCFKDNPEVVRDREELTRLLAEKKKGLSCKG